MCTFFRWDRVFLGMKLAFRFITIPGNSSYNSYTFAHSLCSYFTAALKGMIESSLFPFLQKFRMSLILLFCFEFELLMRFLRRLSSLWPPCKQKYQCKSVEALFVAQTNLCPRPIVLNPNTPRDLGEFHWHFYVRPDIHAHFSFYSWCGRAYCPLE